MEAPIFTISDNAAKRIEFLLKNEKPGSMLRISVDGGGCSGFKYNYEFVESEESGDVIFEKDKAKIIIDDLSLNSFLKGSMLDFTQDLSGSTFEIKNPNSSANCGCGNSFAI
jgi:iron-sulfur cluster assembly accessory protein